MDGDGFGNGSVSQAKCSQPAGYVALGTDCNDSSAAIKPGATEVCNGVDDNCNGSIDEGVKTTYYRDADGDGYGVASTTTAACSAPAGYVSNTTDCNDASAAINPGASETCNGVDDNCNGSIDEGVKTTFYRDADGDTYGSASVTTAACTAPSGYVADSTDCNDASAAIHPGATEINCDGIDQDCSGADTCPCPTPAVLNPLESSSNVTNYPGQWWFDNWLKSQGSYSLTWEVDAYTCGYNAGSDTATLPVVVPIGTVYVTADVQFNNALDSGADTSAQMILTLNGVPQTFGPYPTTQNYLVKQAKWGPFNAATWGKTYTMSVKMSTANSSGNCDGGFSVDNIKSACN